MNRRQHTRDDSKEKIKMGDSWSFLVLKMLFLFTQWREKVYFSADRNNTEKRGKLITQESGVTKAEAKILSRWEELGPSPKVERLVLVRNRGQFIYFNRLKAQVEIETR